MAGNLLSHLVGPRVFINAQVQGILIQGWTELGPCPWEACGPSRAMNCKHFLKGHTQKSDVAVMRAALPESGMS